MLLKIKILFFIIFLGSILTSIYLYNRNKSLNEDLSLAYSNIKAYAGEISSLNKEKQFLKLM